MSYTEILTLSWWGNTVEEYLIALGIFLGVYLLLRVFAKVGVYKIKKAAEYTTTKLDDFLISAVESISWPFYFIVSLYVAAQFVNAHSTVEEVLYYLFLIGITYYVVRILGKLVDFGVKVYADRSKKRNEKFDPSIMKVVGKIVKVFLWIGAGLIIIQNLGYDISALLAGAGIGGLAIAFALQNVLGDIFASFSIYFDRPFEVGDFVIIGSDMGTVKHIGIKTTRLQSLEGQELVISNKELTSARINNYQRMETRRVPVEFGVAYETPVKKLKEIPGIVEKIAGEVENLELDRAHFKEYGEFSLNYEVVYYINSADYNLYMDANQEFNMKLKQELEKRDIVFAYPTHTVYLNREKVDQEAKGSRDQERKRGR